MQNIEKRVEYLGEIINVTPNRWQIKQAKRELREIYPEIENPNVKGEINKLLGRSHLEAEHPRITATLEIGVGAIVAFIGAYYISNLIEYFD